MSFSAALQCTLGLTQILLALIRAPYWLLYYLPRQNRPNASWSVSQCVTVSVMRIVSKSGMNMANHGIGLQPKHYSVPSFPKTKHVWLDPRPELVKGNLQSWATFAGVKPIRIPGYWTDREGQDTPLNQPPAPGEKVLYYLHGGGYITQTANPAYDGTPAIAAKLFKCHPSIKRSFAVEYRLTSGRINPFPSALLDALTGYAYLIEVVGFHPKDIILFGDSAGGNLALALTRYLVERTSDGSTDDPLIRIPAPPLALLLFSPWCDMGTSHSTPDSSTVRNRKTDFLPPPDSGVLLTARFNFCGPHKFPDAANSNPYLSPASVHPAMKVNGHDISFKGFPKTYIVVGDAEVLFDQARTLREKMVRDLGENWVGYHEGKGAVHDFVIFNAWRQETLVAFRDITKWLADVL